MSFQPTQIHHKYQLLNMFIASIKSLTKGFSNMDTITILGTLILTPYLLLLSSYIANVVPMFVFACPLIYNPTQYHSFHHQYHCCVPHCSIYNQPRLAPFLLAFLHLCAQTPVVQEIASIESKVILKLMVHKSAQDLAFQLITFILNCCSQFKYDIHSGALDLVT